MWTIFKYHRISCETLKVKMRQVLYLTDAKHEKLAGASTQFLARGIKRT